MGVPGFTPRAIAMSPLTGLFLGTAYGGKGYSYVAPGGALVIFLIGVPGLTPRAIAVSLLTGLFSGMGYGGKGYRNERHSLECVKWKAHDRIGNRLRF